MTRPYSKDEQKVVEYLKKLLPNMGAGDDPIGFLIASHATIVADNKGLRSENNTLRHEVAKQNIELAELHIKKYTPYFSMVL